MARYADQLPINLAPNGANFLLSTNDSDGKALERIPLDALPKQIPIDWEGAEHGKSIKWDGEKFVFFCLPLLVLGEINLLFLG
jgi:hypothetical protein